MSAVPLPELAVRVVWAEFLAVIPLHAKSAAGYPVAACVLLPLRAITLLGRASVVVEVIAQV